MLMLIPVSKVNLVKIMPPHPTRRVILELGSSVCFTGVYGNLASTKRARQCAS